MFNVVGYRNYHYFWRTLCNYTTHPHHNLSPRDASASERWLVRTVYVAMFATRATAATFRILSSPVKRDQIGSEGIES